MGEKIINEENPIVVDNGKEIDIYGLSYEQHKAIVNGLFYADDCQNYALGLEEKADVIFDLMDDGNYSVTKSIVGYKKGDVVTKKDVYEELCNVGHVLVLHDNMAVANNFLL